MLARRFKRTLMGMLIALSSTRCSASRQMLGDVPSEPFDVMVVPGCPTLQDGSPSRCLLGRAGWAALLYQRGWTKHLITSGGAVHSPYVEAEMLAAILEALGVPADKIVVDPHALHTDENMYNAAQISQALGFKRIAVASDPLQAKWGCRMMQDWGVECAGFAMDLSALAQFLDPVEPRLRELRVRHVDDFMPIEARELQREALTGRKRPSSVFLYPMLGYMAWIGKPWMPIAPPTQSTQTWAGLRGSAL